MSSVLERIGSVVPEACRRRQVVGARAGRDEHGVAIGPNAEPAPSVSHAALLRRTQRAASSTKVAGPAATTIRTDGSQGSFRRSLRRSLTEWNRSFFYRLVSRDSLGRATSIVSGLRPPHGRGDSMREPCFVKSSSGRPEPVPLARLERRVERPDGAAAFTTRSPSVP